MESYVILLIFAFMLTKQIFSNLSTSIAAAFLPTRIFPLLKDSMKLELIEIKFCDKDLQTGASRKF